MAQPILWGLRLALVLGASACTFSSSSDGQSDGGNTNNDDGRPAVPIDADPQAPDAPDGSQSPPDAVIVPPPPPCTALLTQGLVACLEFEDDLSDGSTLDSGPHQLPVPSVGLTGVPGRNGAKAGSVGDAASTFLQATPTLQLNRDFTFAAWIKLDGLGPLGNVLLELDQQSALLVLPGLEGPRLNCAVRNGAVRILTGARVNNTWQFMACTYSAGVLCSARIGTNQEPDRTCGNVAGNDVLTNAVGGVAVGHASNQGVATGPRMEGAIDSLWIYDRRLNANELCVLAGRPADCLAD